MTGAGSRSLDLADVVLVSESAWRSVVLVPSSARRPVPRRCRSRFDPGGAVGGVLAAVPRRDVVRDPFFGAEVVTAQLGRRATVGDGLGGDPALEQLASELVEPAAGLNPVI